MAAVISFFAGYLLGARAGRQGLEELRSAWQTVSTSAEVRQLVGGVVAAGRDLVGEARGRLAERLQPGLSPSRLRSVA